MGDGTATGLLNDLLAQSYGGAFASPTSGITFGERFVAVQTPEAPFIEHQLDQMAAQGHIAFATGTHIMLFDTHRPTVWAALSCFGGDHLDAELSIRLPFLPHQTQAL
jgi:hypothetical protein